MDTAITSFKSHHDQIDALNTLRAILKTGRIPNALIFTGDKGTGRKEAAFLFAASMNCTDNCNDKFEGQKVLLSRNITNLCVSCRKIFSGIHPDIMMVSPEKEIIKIHQIRAIYASIATRPHEAKMRMVLIEDADTMNSEASNALLKILEEPPDSTFFILLASDLLHMLPTILSRCRHIRFKPVSPGSIEKRLICEHGIEKKMAKIIAYSSSGSMERALMMLNLNETSHIDWLKRRKWLLTQLSVLLYRSGSNAVSDNNFSGAIFALMLAEKIAEEPALIRDTLMIIRTFLRDIAVIRFRQKQVINSDVIDKLQKIMNSISFEKSISWFHLFNELERKLHSNAAVRLLLEQFFIGLVFEDIYRR